MADSSKTTDVAQGPHRIGYYRDHCQPPMSQQALADAIGSSRNSIIEWEKNGVGREERLFQIVRIFVERGAISDYQTASLLWKGGSKKGTEAPPELARLFQQPNVPDVLSQAGPVAEQIAIVSEAPRETALTNPAATALLQAAFVAVPTTATLVHPRSFYPRRPRMLLIGLMLLMLIAITFIVLRPTKTQTVVPRGSIPFAANGQLAPAFTFRRGGSFYSRTKVDEATNTLTLIAGPRTDQHATDVSAPVVTVPVRGDFDATVHAEAQFSGSECCQQVGIGVRSPTDPTTWIRITRDHREMLTVNANRGERHITTHNIVTASSLDLRIQRNGNRFSFFYRESGTSWVSFDEPIEFDLTQDAELYLVVYSAHNDQTSAGAFSNLVVR